jgi:hypothetical protein
MSQQNIRLKYEQRLTLFATDINVMTLGDKLNQVPGEKSYWANELSKAEQSLRGLEMKKKKLVKNLSKKLLDNSPVKLNKSTFDKIEESESVEELTDEIEDMKLTVKQLERIYETIKYSAKDFENILKFHQLEMN